MNGLKDTVASWDVDGNSLVGVDEVLEGIGIFVFDVGEGDGDSTVGFRDMGRGDFKDVGLVDGWNVVELGKEAEWVGERVFVDRDVVRIARRLSE